MAPLGSRDIRALKILGVFLLLVGLAALVVYVFMPQQERLDRAKEDLQTAEMQLRADLRRLSKAREAEDALNQALERLRREEELIADEVKQAYFIRDLEEMAKRAGIKLDSVRFTEGKPLGRFLDVGTYIEVTGSFAGVKMFYDALELLNRKLAVTSFNFDLQSEAVIDELGETTQRDTLHSTCNLSLFIRPKGGVASGSAQ